MAVPKCKQSKARSRARRAHWKLDVPNLVKCSRCHSLKMPHRVCKECGFYAGKEVIKIEA